MSNETITPQDIYIDNNVAQTNEVINWVITQNDVTVAQMREKISSILEIDGINEGVVHNYSRTFKNVTAGYDDTRIQALPPNVLGVNYKLGTTNTGVNVNLFTTGSIEQNQTAIKTVLMHEAHTELGHAGQTEVNDLVDTDGQVVDSLTVLEGVVEANTAKKFGDRPGQPVEVYGKGQTFVEGVGHSAMQTYTSTGNRVAAQVHIFKQSDLKASEMQESMEQAEFTTAEIDRVMQQVRKNFLQGPNVTTTSRQMSV